MLAPPPLPRPWVVPTRGPFHKIQKSFSRSAGNVSVIVASRGKTIYGSVNCTYSNWSLPDEEASGPSAICTSRLEVSFSWTRWSKGCRSIHILPPSRQQLYSVLATSINSTAGLTKSLPSTQMGIAGGFLPAPVSSLFLTSYASQSHYAHIDILSCSKKQTVQKIKDLQSSKQLSCINM